MQWSTSGYERQKCHLWSTSGTQAANGGWDLPLMASDGPAPAKNGAGGPPATSWTSVWWATTANRWHSVRAHHYVAVWVTVFLIGQCLKLNKSVVFK